MAGLSLTTEDVVGHVVKLGMDIYPPIQIPTQRTKLNIFYEEVRSRHATLFDKLIVSDTEFVISKEFRSQTQADARATIQTFALTPRGPVFTFPLVIPAPIDATGLEEQHLELFDELRKAFFVAIPGLDCLRLGLIRELVFSTGQTTGHSLIGRQSSFAGATLAGSEITRVYRDDKFNHKLSIATVEMRRQTKLVTGQTVQEPVGFGITVALDVNNHVLRPLEETDMTEVIERANSLWPEELLGYLGGEGGSEE